MATEIKMPQLSDTMDAGKILTWNKKEGEQIERGDVLAEVETDKANLEIESFHVGTLLKIVAPEGTNAKVGSVIAYIGKEGEEVKIEDSPKSNNIEQKEIENEPVTTPEPTAKSINTEEPVNIDSYEDSQTKASPLARKLAKEANIDLSTISGSGPNGRIIKKDIETALTSTSSTASSSTRIESTRAPSNIPSATSPGLGKSEKLSKMRATIAQRMQQSVQEIPHFYTTISIDMREASQLRKTLKEREDFKSLSFNHFVIKAAGYALEQEPRVNCSYKDGEIYQPDSINIGIITAVDDGLLIPVIQNVPKLPLRDLVLQAKSAVDRARAGKPSSADLSGGTFSISNMGMLGVENFTAIINPGQGAVLAVSSILETPVVRNGIVEPGLQMKVTLSVDHRIIDGIIAGKFLGHFKQALEMPALMLA